MRESAGVAGAPGGAANAPPSTAIAALAGQAEPSLLPSSSRLLRRLPADALERRYLQHLAQRLRRNPRDLRAHVRRVLIHHARADVAGVDEALVALFDVLGTQGYALRLRMLQQVGDLLTPARQRFFTARLADGSIRAAPATRPMVVVCRSDGTSAPDLVASARDAVARGHDERAQLLLEGAVTADCGDARVCAELLTLYRRRDAKAAFLRMRATLLGRQVALADEWLALARHFSMHT